jgi:hypothetical protein
MRSDPRFDTAQDKIDDDVNETDRDHASITIFVATFSCPYALI